MNPTWPEMHQNPNPSSDQTPSLSDYYLHHHSQYLNLYPYHQQQQQQYTTTTTTTSIDPNYTLQQLPQPQLVHQPAPPGVEPPVTATYTLQAPVSYESQQGAAVTATPASYYFEPNVNWAATAAVGQYGAPAATYAVGSATVNPAKPQSSKARKKKVVKKTKVVQPARCDVCKIDCNSQAILDQHRLGKKHKKNLEKLKAKFAGIAGPAIGATPTATAFTSGASVATSTPVVAISYASVATSTPVVAPSPTIAAPPTTAVATSPAIAVAPTTAIATSPAAAATSTPLVATCPAIAATSTPLAATSPAIAATSTPLVATSPAIAALCTPVIATSAAINATSSIAATPVVDISSASDATSTPMIAPSSTIASSAAINAPSSTAATSTTNIATSADIAATSTQLPNSVIAPTNEPITGPKENPVKSRPPNAKKSRKKATIASVEDLEAKRRKVLEGGATADNVRACNICNVVCNSATVFNHHLAGQKHAAMVKKHISSEAAPAM